MTGKQRLGMLAVAVIVAVAAFVIVKPGDDEDEGGGTPAADTAPANGASNDDATAESAPPPPAPTVHIVRLNDFAPRGGVQDFEAEKGETVRILVTSDVADEVHLHGYDITRNAAPGKPARFRFKADIEGIFEIESHEAEHAGKEAVIANLTVRPS